MMNDVRSAFLDLQFFFVVAWLIQKPNRSRQGHDHHSMPASMLIHFSLALLDSAH